MPKCGCPSQTCPPRIHHDRVQSVAQVAKRRDFRVATAGPQKKGRPDGAHHPQRAGAVHGEVLDAVPFRARDALDTSGADPNGSVIGGRQDVPALVPDDAPHHISRWTGGNGVVPQTPTSQKPGQGGSQDPERAFPVPQNGPDPPHGQPERGIHVDRIQAGEMQGTRLGREPEAAIAI